MSPNYCLILCLLTAYSLAAINFPLKRHYVREEKDLDAYTKKINSKYGINTSFNSLASNCLL